MTMPLTRAVAENIAELLNTQNQLTIPYTVARILTKQDRYIVRYGDDDKVLGVVEVKEVQWYQYEIDHLSVSPHHRRQGIGSWLVQEAEKRAKELGAGITQCTIRVGNVGSEELFRENGYSPTVTFHNARTGNDVTVYQKIPVGMEPFWVGLEFPRRI